MTKKVLSLEEAVMTTHDWVVHQTKAPVAELGVDFTNPTQPVLYVDRADGGADKEVREWVTDPEEAVSDFQDTWVEMEPAQQYQHIVENTRLVTTTPLEEENGDIPTGGVTLESIATLTEDIRTQFSAGGFSRAISDRFQRLTKSFDLYRQNRLRTKEFSVDLSRNAKLARKITKVPYATLCEFNIYCPPGQSTTTLELLECLKECQEYSAQLIHGAVRPFTNWLKQSSVTSGGFASAANGLNIDIQSPKALATKLGKALANGSVVERKYCDLYARNSDYERSFEVAEELLASFSAYSSTRVAEDIRELAVILTQVADQLQREAIGKITTAKGVAIADYVFELAKAVEFYSVYATVLRATMVAMEDSSRKLDEIVSRK